MIRRALPAMLLLPGAVQAAGLTVTKTSTVVADGVSAIMPRALPGALVDCSTTVVNPIGNLLSTVAGVTVVEPLSPSVKLRVVDLSGGGGPVEFVDGALLGLGLAGSGLGFSFASLGSGGDGVDFSADGVTWTYVPVPDAQGFDARVRAVRVRLSGAQAAGGGFRLRYRVAVK